MGKSKRGKRSAPTVAEARASRAPWGRLQTGHKIMVTYVTPGSGLDGIHLACTCAWTAHLGEHPTVEEVVLTARQHEHQIRLAAT